MKATGETTRAASAEPDLDVAEAAAQHADDQEKKGNRFVRIADAQSGLLEVCAGGASAAPLAACRGRARGVGLPCAAGSRRE